MVVWIVSQKKFSATKQLTPPPTHHQKVQILNLPQHLFTLLNHWTKLLLVCCWKFWSEQLAPNRHLTLYRLLIKKFLVTIIIFWKEFPWCTRKACTFSMHQRRPTISRSKKDLKAKASFKLVTPINWYMIVHLHWH